MKRLSLLLTLLGLWSTAVSQTVAPAANPLKGQRVLVFSKTRAFRHASIPDGVRAIEALGRRNGFGVTATENSDYFVEDSLKKFREVVFLSTTGDVLGEAQQRAFERYIQAGGGYVGIHAAADTEYDWPWYGRMVGGWFESHPGNPNVRKGDMTVMDRNHPATAELPEKFNRSDEFYDFKRFNRDSVRTLITVDEKSYNWNKMGDFHPMAWYHNYDGGRVFYTAYGHTSETFMEPLFLQHLWGGMRWAADGPPLDFGRARTQPAPEENRFARSVLDDKLYEPTELAVLGNDKVMYIHRRGAIKLYDAAATPQVRTLDTVQVMYRNEYGLMGLGTDPNFKQNNWLYMYYSPATEKYGADTANRLVRVKFDPLQNKINWSTEQVLLRVPVKRDGCCHTGGSIDWDRQGNLYLSTGDDTNPFDSDGFSPSDNRPGRRGWNALATSSNTNDLRGKILRIRPNDDGTPGYSIPDGNLFPKNTANARPEIYVMGNRNPYRIAVDKHTGFLYWGEVGPDAGESKDDRGPRGYDEVNQARQAGFYGWPMFVADNRAYNQYDFGTKTSGERYDPAKPVNNSPHNTGLRELPPARKALIYYPYAASPEFGPVVGQGGGRNAMAGPVYYREDYDKDSKVAFPDYYQGKFFAYDWIRDFINVVTMKPNGDFESMERFVPSWKLYHPMDMAFAPDGSLYMLEYGPNWFAQNDEARLSHITFNAGNRPPVAELTASKTAGAVPMLVNFSGKNSKEYDGDPLTYEWNINGKKFTTPAAAYTFTKPGLYKVMLTVKDNQGNSSSNSVEIKAGNEVPKVEVAVKGNRTFFFADQPIEYEVKVADREDGTLAGRKIAPEDVVVSVDFMQGFDRTAIAQGHQAGVSLSAGKRLMDLSDCKACHAIDKKSIGPSFMDIAKRYKPTAQDIDQLSNKVIAGGGGVWGEQAMSAHPQLSKNDASEMVRYILSLSDPKKAGRPVRDKYMPANTGKPGMYLVSATYTDRGGPAVPPQTARQTLALRSPVVPAVVNDGEKAIMKYKVGDDELAIGLESGSYVMFRAIDLTGIAALRATAFTMKGQTAGGEIELHGGSPAGPLLGRATVADGHTGPVTLTLTPTARQQDLYVVMTNKEAKPGTPLMGVGTLEFMPATTKASAGGGR